MTNTKVTQVQELRRSNAATAIPSRKTRRERTRGAKDRAAIRRSREGN